MFIYGNIVIGPLTITGLIFFATTLFTAISIYKSPFVLKIISDYKYYLITIIAINIFIKFSFFNNTFNGLEYEDAYIYNATARYYLLNTNNEINSFLTNCCVLGSLKDCWVYGTFSGHVIGYPFLIYLLSKLFGYNPYFANIISYCFSCFSAVTIFILAFYIINDIYYAISSSVVFSCIPIFNVYSATSFSEPISNAFIIATMLLYMIYISDIQDKYIRTKNIIWHLIPLYLILAYLILIKRENIIVGICLLLATLIHFVKNHDYKIHYNIKKVIYFLPSLIISGIIALVVINYFQTLECEEIEIAAKAFSISYFKVNIIKIIDGLLIYDWYLIFTLFMVIGLTISIKYDKSYYLLTVFIGYTILYTFHHRSYYFVKGGGVTEIEFVRYTINIIGVYSLIAGLGIYHMGKLIYNYIISNFRFKIFHINIGVFIIIIMICSISFYKTICLRTNLVSLENAKRIQPMESVLEYLKGKKAVVVTMDTLLYQIFGPDNLELVSIATINKCKPIQYFNNIIKQNDVYYVEKDEYSDTLNQERWAEQFDYLNNKKGTLCYYGDNGSVKWKIYKLRN